MRVSSGEHFIMIWISSLQVGMGFLRGPFIKPLCLKLTSFPTMGELVCCSSTFPLCQPLLWVTSLQDIPNTNVDWVLVSKYLGGLVSDVSGILCHSHGPEKYFSFN